MTRIHTPSLPVGALTRRELLLTAAALAGVAAAGAPGVSSASFTPGVRGLVLSDPRLADPEAYRDRVAAGAAAVGIQRDLGTQWHGSLREQVRALPSGAVVTGLSTWIDFVVLRGCLAEVGFAARRHEEHCNLEGQVQAVSWSFGRR